MIRFGPLGPATVNVCVDMQRMFAEPTEWQTPWMERVTPSIVSLIEPFSAQTVFTRFIPIEEPGQGRGTWRRYYERWESMTLPRVGIEMIDLIAPLARYAPPAVVVDKRVYSPWFDGSLFSYLTKKQVDCLVVSGSETEVCVLATVLGAVDLGYRVIVATDAVCSSADSTHDAMLEVYEGRYGMQVETAAVDEILDSWQRY